MLYLGEYPVGHRWSSAGYYFSSCWRPMTHLKAVVLDSSSSGGAGYKRDPLGTDWNLNWFPKKSKVLNVI